MRKVFAFLCLLLFSMGASAWSFSISDSNEYEIRRGIGRSQSPLGPVWIAFREGDEYKLKCRLDPESRIRFKEEKEGFVYAEIISASESGPYRGSCREQHRNVRIAPDEIEKRLDDGSMHMIRR
ncbi:MAG: hypothetical protein HY506_00905 [Candidatus Yanofskybacteria bacterium]|nr:hypothetical protein [Candidatus Yanofskybacteria bacterium]